MKFLTIIITLLFTLHINAQRPERKEVTITGKVIDIETNQPKYIVVVNISASWLQQPNSYSLFKDWQRGYIKEKYELTGLAYIMSRDKTIYKWGRESVLKFLPFTRSNPNKMNLLIFKRKSEKKT